MEKKITFAGILTNGVEIGLKNIASLLGAIILYILTCWIPYINIGTTIAMSSLPLLMAKGEVFSPLSIFDKKYRQFMGEYFILNGLMFMAILVGLFFFIIPGFVLSIAWSLAILFLLDKQQNPLEALMSSNKATNGYKWILFLASLVLSLVFVILWTVFLMIPFIGWVFGALAAIAFMAIQMGATAYIYKELSK